MSIIDKEPYYTSTVLSIKSSNPQFYSFISHDIPPISPKSLLRAPSFDYAASNCQTSQVKKRSSSIEPYYVKSPKISSLTPVITGLYKYEFGSKYGSDESAIVSDNEDEETDDDMNSMMKHPNIAPPDSSSARFHRKVSDNYGSSADYKIEDEFTYDSRKITACSSSSISNSFPPHVHNLEEVNNSRYERSQNPNILINPVARSVSVTTLPPQCKPLFVNDAFQNSGKSNNIRDDYDYSSKPEFLI